MELTRDPNISLLGNEDFSPEKYVKDLSQNCVGGPELRRLRMKIQSLAEETNSTLKKNVYQNYMQFIDSAKEISHLESEMYQLSHLLSEQKSLLMAFSSTSILGDDAIPVKKQEDTEKQNTQEEENREKLATILEKVEGCKDLLEVTGRNYLHEGTLQEIDPLENNAIKTVQAYLFTDGLMIAGKNANSRGLMKYVFECMYEIGSLGVVNVRDLGHIKHAFKLLIFPDTRIFKCASSTSKKDWLDKFDRAKKARLAQDQQKRESIAEKSPSRSVSIDCASFNPFEEAEDELTVHPEWFLDTPEELDVCVAQRHFEDAIVFLQKGKDYISEFTTANGQVDHVILDIQRKIDLRHNNLTEVLMKELDVSPDKSLQGGLLASRRAVRLLNKLGRSTQSCNLFLKLCSCMLKSQYKRVKREGSTTMYVRHLSSVVFTNMCRMTEEFLKAFPDSPTCSSAYIVWASGELSFFTTHFIKQVFMPQTSLSTLTECVVMIRSQCEQICNYGVDLCYQLDGSLRTPVTKALKEARDKLSDSVKLRALEDKWIPTNLRTKTALVKCLQEHSDLGLKLESYVTGDVWLQLTPNTMAFTKLFISLLDDCMKIKTTELLYVIDETLYDVFDAQIRHNETSLRNEKHEEQRQFIIKNAEFLLVTLINLCQDKYFAANSFKSKSMVKIQKEYTALVNGISPTSRSTKKYSSDFL